MIYVRDLRPDSICDTALAFLAMNSSYLVKYLEGIAKALDIGDGTEDEGGDGLPVAASGAPIVIQMSLTSEKQVLE